jgi:signal transduction histidine kinase
MFVKIILILQQLFNNLVAFVVGRVVLFLLIYFVVLTFSSCKNGENMMSESEAYLVDSTEVAALLNHYDEVFSTDDAKAQQFISQAIDKVNTSDFKYKLLLQIIQKISLKELYRGNIQLIDSLTANVVNVIPIIDDNSFREKAYGQRAVFFNTTDKDDSAIFYYQKMDSMAVLNQHIMGEIVAKANLATKYTYSIRIEEGIELFEKVLVISEREQFDGISAGISNNLANAYTGLGQTFTAISYYQKSVELYEKVGEKVQILNPIMNLANAYKHLGLDSMAESGYKKTVELALEQKNYRMYGLTVNNYADLLSNRQEYTQAIDVMREALKKQVQEGYVSDYNYLHYYRMMSNIFNKMGEHDTSLIYSRYAYNRSIADGQDYSIPELGLILSLAHFEKKNYDSSYYFANKGYEYALKFKDKSNEAELLNTLARVHTVKGDLKRAVDYYKAFSKSSREVIDTLKAGSAKDLAFAFELRRKDAQNVALEKEKALVEMEKKNHESTIKFQGTIIVLSVVVFVILIVLLVALIRQSRQRKEMNAVLSEENTFKGHLLSIVTHDLRSPLIALHSMLNLLKIEEFDEATRARAIDDLLAQTEKSIDLSDNLLFWTREQLKGAGITKEKFDLHTLVDEILINEVSARKKEEVTVENLLPEKLEIYADKNILHLVLRNLISNAFKFTLPGGVITITHKTEGNSYILSVADTGVGIDNVNLGKILNDAATISMKGVRGEKGKGFGLLLCKYFLQKCQGHLWFESEKDKGTTFSFSIPVES